MSGRIQTSAGGSWVSGPGSLRVYARVFLPFDASRWLPCANILGTILCTPFRCPESAHLSRVLVCPAGAAPSGALWQLRPLQQHRQQRPHILHTVIVLGAARRQARAAVGTKLFGTSAKWARYEPTLSAPLERTPCSPARHHAPSWLPDCPTLRSIFLARTSAPLAHMNRVLSDTLRGGRARRPCGQGGSSARAAAPE